jgi:plastocyanin
MSQLYNLKAGVSTQADLVTAPDYVTVASADGAVTIQSGTVLITKGTAAALTLGTPTAAQNGTTIRFIATTAAAHTVAAATIGFNAGDAAKDTGTFGGAIGDGFACVAYGGEWYTFSVTNVTFA